MQHQPSSIELVSEKKQNVVAILAMMVVIGIVNLGVVAYIFTLESVEFPDNLRIPVIAFVALVEVFGVWMTHRALHNRVIRISIDRQTLFVQRVRDQKEGSAGEHISLNPSTKMTAEAISNKSAQDLLITYVDPSGKTQTLVLDGHTFSREEQQRMKDWIDSRSTAA